MRVGRDYKHIHAMRSAQGVDGGLQAREPALINLPIPLPLPSIPIVAPILTNIIAGKPTTTTQATTSTPTSTSPSGSSGGSESGSSSGNTGSSGGGGGSESTGGQTGGGSSGQPGNGGGSQGSSGSESNCGSSNGGSTSGSTSDAGQSGNTPSGEGDSSGGEILGGSQTGGSPTDTVVSSATKSTKGESGAGDEAHDATPGQSNGPPNETGSSSTSPPGVVNAASGHTFGGSQDEDSSSTNNPASGGSHASLGGSPTTSSTGSSSGSGTTITSGNTINGGNNGSVPSDTAATSNGKGISGAAIAGIVSALIIILLCLLVFFLRRRSIARRSERRLRWWSRRNAGSPQSAEATVGSGTASVRSSFATTFDHGLSPHFSVTFDASGLPEPPPMAEIRNSPNSSPIATRGGPMTLPPLLINVESERRISVYSTHSDGSEEGQYLVIHPSSAMVRPKQDLLAPDVATPTSLPTPMSVRPFSPSESFSFPKPPGKRESQWSKCDSSRPTSMKSSKSVARKPPPLALLDNPFADPSNKEEKLPIQDNPEFAEVEVIQRPFRPTLDDELGVGPGDKVRVVQSFDDGWAFVEKMVNNDQTYSGLIPIDCMRAENQDLPTFLASKRVSSYSNAYLAI
ncbi:hypothetical protein ONZ45_g9236 [Pleurotus djamor]|nr:hypothetical protein ONZ45_g9236 [Pleurotus djamor]